MGWGHIGGALLGRRLRARPSRCSRLTVLTWVVPCLLVSGVPALHVSLSREESILRGRIHASGPPPRADYLNISTRSKPGESKWSSGDISPLSQSPSEVTMPEIHHFWLCRSITLSLCTKAIEAATAGHKVPPSTNSLSYVFGSGTLLMFVLRTVTESAWRWCTYLLRVRPGRSLQYPQHCVQFRDGSFAMCTIGARSSW